MNASGGKGCSMAEASCVEKPKRGKKASSDVVSEPVTKSAKIKNAEESKTEAKPKRTRKAKE